MCELYAGCRNPPEVLVEMKAVMKKAASTYESCSKCAATIGKRTQEGPIIDRPGMESASYKITLL